MVQVELWRAAMLVFDYLNEERVVVNSLTSGHGNDHKTNQVWTRATFGQEGGREDGSVQWCSMAVCCLLVVVVVVRGGGGGGGGGEQITLVQNALMPTEKQLLDLVNAIITQVGEYCWCWCYMLVLRVGALVLVLRAGVVGVGAACCVLVLHAGAACWCCWCCCSMVVRMLK
jgi:hypothetical protein